MCIASIDVLLKRHQNWIRDSNTQFCSALCNLSFPLVLIAHNTRSMTVVQCYTAE